MPLQIDFLTERDLRAYAEGALDDDMEEAIRRYLAKDSTARHRVERYREQAQACRMMSFSALSDRR